MIPLDPFDLPGWLLEGQVVWRSDAGLHGSRVAGTLVGAGGSLACDLFGVDDAFPAPAAEPETRVEAHRAWRHGQLSLVDEQGRLTLAVPVREFTADLVLEVVARFARAVGADPSSYVVQLGLSDRRQR